MQRSWEAPGHGRAIVMLLAIAFALRVATVLAYPLIHGRTGLSHGSDGYEHVAATLTAGYGYRFAPELGETMLLPPAYPLFLAGLFLLTGGESLLAATLAQCVLDTASCLFLYLLAARHGGHRLGFWAALLYALYPGAWIGCARYLTEPLFVFLILGFLLFFTRFIAHGRTRALLSAAAFLAVATLCKSVAGALPLFVLAAASVMPAWRGIRLRAVGGVAVCLLATALAIAPWIYRNYRLTGAWVYPTTLTGQALYTAHVYVAHPSQRIRDSVNQSAAEMRQIAVEHGIRLDPRDAYPRWFYDPKDEVKLDRLLQGIARQRIDGDRGGYVRHVAGNLWRFWWGAPTPKSMVASVAANTPLMILGGIGLFMAGAWRYPDLTLCAVVGLYLFLAHVAVLAVVRYSLTVMPIVCLFGAFVAARSWRFRLRSSFVAFGNGDSTAKVPACL